MDKEFVKKFVEKYPEIKELFERHQALEKELEELNKKNILPRKRK